MSFVITIEDLKAKLEKIVTAYETAYSSDDESTNMMETGEYYLAKELLLDLDRLVYVR